MPSNTERPRNQASSIEELLLMVQARDAEIDLLKLLVQNKVFIGVPHPPYTDLNSPQDRDRVTAYLADMTAKMITTLKPRLEAALRSLRVT